MPPPPDSYFPGKDQAPPASRLTLDYQIGVYLADYRVTRYWNHSGQLAIPVAAADGAAQEFVKAFATRGGKVVFFVVERFGLMPLVPGIETGDSNSVYLFGQVVVDAPGVHTDGGTQIFHVEGYYVYGFKQPVFANSSAGLPMSSRLTDRTPPAKNVLPRAAFVDLTSVPTPYVAPGDNLTLTRSSLTPAGPPQVAKNRVSGP